MLWRPVTGSPVGADARIRPRVDASIDPYACPENHRLQIRGGQRTGRPTFVGGIHPSRVIGDAAPDDCTEIIPGNL